MGKKQIFSKISPIILFFLLALPDSLAAVPQQTPYYAVGSDFLVMDGIISNYLPDLAYPRINTLFNNTKIYLDNNNDGVWDYSFLGNAGDIIKIDPLIEPPKFGAKIRTDKPVSYYQTGYYTPNNYFIFTMPPINSWRNEYVIAYNSLGSYSILTEKTITVFIEEFSKVSNITVRKGERPVLNYASFARVYSDDAFSLVSYNSPAAIKGKSFFAPYTLLRIVVFETGTDISIDYDNDGHYDNVTQYNRGLYDISALQGSKIISSKNIALFSYLQGGTVGALPSDTLGSDFYATGGYLIGLFSEQTGFFNRTTFDVSLQKTNLLNVTSFIYSNYLYSYPITGNVHVSSNMPTIPISISSASGGKRSLNTYPYSQIYLTTYSSKKYISNNEANTFVVRIFNPFQKDNATNFHLAVNYPANFTSLSNVVIERRSLMNDAVLESVSANYDLVIDGFTLNPSSNALLDYLGPLQYFEIRYDLITPDTLGTFLFPAARMTYDAQTWVI